MGEAKKIIVKPISSKRARDIVKKFHYSGKVCNNSNFHLGVFYKGVLEGAIQFGPPIDKRKLIHLVPGTKWSQMLELNRMAFSDVLPRNSESRAMGYVFKMLKKHRPDIKWVVSFSDATQCGDGVIYRASGFILSAIKRSDNLAKLPNGDVIHKMTLHSNPLKKRAELGNKSFYDVTGGKYNWKLYCKIANAVILPGYQLRYIKFIDASWEKKLTVTPIPFNEIPTHVKMYKGKKIMRLPDKEASGDHPEKGGANPTQPLQFLQVSNEKKK